MADLEVEQESHSLGCGDRGESWDLQRRWSTHEGQGSCSTALMKDAVDSGLKNVRDERDQGPEQYQAVRNHQRTAQKSRWAWEVGICFRFGRVSVWMKGFCFVEEYR